MELLAARFCRASSAVHNEQVMLRLSSRYQHQLHKLMVIISNAREVGRDGEQVVAERKGEKLPAAECHRGWNDTEWLKRSQRLPGAGLWPRIQQTPSEKPGGPITAELNWPRNRKTPPLPLQTAERGNPIWEAGLREQDNMKCNRELRRLRSRWQRANVLACQLSVSKDGWF